MAIVMSKEYKQDKGKPEKIIYIIYFIILSIFYS